MQNSQSLPWELFTQCIIPPVPAVGYGSIGVVLWLLCFRSAPSTFPQKTGHLLRGHFWESLVFTNFRFSVVHSKIGQIHLSIEHGLDVPSCPLLFTIYILDIIKREQKVHPDRGIEAQCDHHRYTSHYTGQCM